jgi:hypothetical protein
VYSMGVGALYLLALHLPQVHLHAPQAIQRQPFSLRRAESSFGLWFTSSSSGTAMLASDKLYETIIGMADGREQLLP